MADTAPAPIRAEERIAALDALRGLALCGILLMNLPWMGFISFGFYPLVPDPGWNPASAAYWVQRVFFEGTMRGLFSMLFGAGILLFMAKGEAPGASRGDALGLMLRRLLFLGLFGIIDMTLLLWPGDILTVYAVAALMVLPLRRLSVRKLLLAAALFMAANMAWAVMGVAFTELPLLKEGPRVEAAAQSGAALTEAEIVTLESWRSLQRGGPPSPEEIAETGSARLGNYAANVAFQSRVSYEAWFVEWEGLVWIITDSAAFMLFGMALFRLGWLQGSAAPWQYRRLLLVGYGIGLPLRIWDAGFQWEAIQGWTPTAFDLIAPQLAVQPGRLLVTLGHLALFHLAYRAAARRFAPLAALGRMAFTGYLGQSLIAALLFGGFGLALWGRIDLATVFVIAPAIWIVEVLFAVWWFRHHRMGPMEQVWRWLTYGRTPPRTAPA